MNTTKKSTSETGAAAMASAMQAFAPAGAQAWFDIMTESTEFIVKRLQHDIETQQAMLRCKSPAELMQIQTEFFQTAIQQYSEEAAQLFRMMTEATAETMKEAETGETGQARSYDDVPL